MVMRGMVALVLVAVFAATGAVLFSLDSMAASREKDEPSAAAPAVVQDHNVALPLASFAGQVPGNADELAKAHKPYDATLPALQPGGLAKVHMTLKDMTVEVAPGVKYNTWAFDGHGAPGPVVHVREGQTVEMTLTNGGAIPHSID
ncbi:MAG: hypothetical protein ABI717_06930, partial [Actinomycetota bacterium]